MDFVKQLGVRGLNHLIGSEPWAQDRLRKHAGAQLLILAGPIFSIRLGVDHAGLFHLATGVNEPDVRLTLPADVPIRAVLDRDNLFSSVKLDGSVDVAESLAFVFRNLEWDIEADLAALIGDIPAHRFVRIGRSLAHSLRQGAGNLLANAREYAVEEADFLPNMNAVAAFGNAVNALRDDVARLEKRLSRL